MGKSKNEYLLNLPDGVTASLKNVEYWTRGDLSGDGKRT